MNPADEMRAAADKLRSTCAAASPGPWTIATVPPYTDPLLISRFQETPEEGEVLIVGNIDVEPEDQAVVQMLHPGVGAKLTKWLDETATEVQAAEGTEYALHPEGGVFTSWEAALAVARALLGGAS